MQQPNPDNNNVQFQNLQSMSIILMQYQPCSVGKNSTIESRRPPTNRTTPYTMWLRLDFVSIRHFRYYALAIYKMLPAPLPSHSRQAFITRTNRVENMTDEEYSKYHASAMEIMTGPMAKQAGITYLEEGTHTFTLKSGSSFNVYASPYTVGSGGWAFPYKSNEDRFNAPNQTAANKISVSENPIPLGVHIVMTHGPPYSILDQVDGQNLGCPNLLRAISRVRPMMHCFGHIHEGHGANIVTWMPDGTAKDPSAATPMETEQINEYLYANKWPVQSGKQTLMVNAAIMRNTAKGMRPDYKPFIVSLDLPCP
ncbi:hypothetical protein ACMFMF_006558 [Clarireedia jacksonii]